MTNTNYHNALPNNANPPNNWEGVLQVSGSPIGKASEEFTVPKSDYLINPSLPKPEQIKQAKAIIASIPDKKEALVALTILWGLIREDYGENKLGQKDSFMDYLETLRTSYSGYAIGKRALRYQILWNVLAGKNDQVVSLSQKALKILDIEDQGYILGDLAYTYLRKGWPDKAAECLTSLNSRSDKNELLNVTLENDIVDTWQLIADGLMRPDVFMPADNETDVPVSFDVVQNYPNPANPSTAIRFSLPEKTAVSVKIVNILGEVVCNLANRPFEAGVHEVVWGGKNERGMTVSSGIYLYVLQTPNKVISKKLTLLK